jgi:polyhydroxyalkanoate synthesis regulator phasin
MKPTTLLLLFLLTLVLPSCHQQQPEQEVMAEVDLMQVPPPPEAKLASMPPQKVPEPSIERKIIKEGFISFETRDAKETAQQIAWAVDRYKGYITEDVTTDYETRLDHRVTIRVPASQFDALLETIAQGADEVKSKNISAKDVTEEYVDVVSRIKTKKELEARYQQLLQKATKVEEMLSIEREMGTLRTDIESMEGRLRYLKDRVAFSTLTVNYYEIAPVSSGFWDRLRVALGDGWDNMLEFMVAVVGLWPLVVLGVIALLLLKRFRRSRKITT